MKKQLQETLIQSLDARVGQLRSVRQAAVRPARGWLRATRTALGLSQGEVATRLSLTQQAYADYEAAEERGAITVQSLQRAAEALGCELVYFLVPREPGVETFRDLAEHADPHAKQLAASEHSMALENQAVGDLRRRRKS